MGLSTRKFKIAAILVLYFCAGLQFVRFYVKTTDLYINMPAYIAGHERLPFQERVLPVLLLWPIFHSPHIMAGMNHTDGVLTPTRGPFYLISLLGLFSAAALTQLLYHRLSRTRTLALFVFPVFLYTVMWAYSIHNEANYSYPYDFLSLAFFTGGLLCIYERKYWALFAVMLIGSLNRETTLFLIGIFILDAASREVPQGTRLPQRFAWTQVPWLRAGLLFAVWLAVKLTLGHLFRFNSHAEYYDRIPENFGRLRLRLLPALLNFCGYLFPLVVLFWKRILPVRFGNYVWVIALWLPVMFYSGVILETRIYGELCSYTAIAAVLLAEQYAAAKQAALTPVSTLQTAEAQPVPLQEAA